MMDKKPRVLETRSAVLYALSIPLVSFVILLVVVYRVPWGQRWSWPLNINFEQVGPLSEWFAGLVTLALLTFAMYELDDRARHKRRRRLLEADAIDVRLRNRPWQLANVITNVTIVTLTYTGRNRIILESIELNSEPPALGASTACTRVKVNDRLISLPTELDRPGMKAKLALVDEPDLLDRGILVHWTVDYGEGDTESHSKWVPCERA